MKSSLRSRAKACWQSLSVNSLRLLEKVAFWCFDRIDELNQKRAKNPIIYPAVKAVISRYEHFMDKHLITLMFQLYKSKAIPLLKTVGWLSVLFIISMINPLGLFAKDSASYIWMAAGLVLGVLGLLTLHFLVFYRLISRVAFVGIFVFSAMKANIGFAIAGYFLLLTSHMIWLTGAIRYNKSTVKP